MDELEMPRLLQITDELTSAVQRTTGRQWYEDDAAFLRENLGVIADSLRRLEDALGDEDAPPPPMETTDAFFSLGRYETVETRRPIWGGHLEPIVGRTLPVRSRVVVAFLISLPDRDLLKRERHSHFGWHYHYLDARERRSDIVLCWDIRATVQTGLVRPLFQEKHAEGGSAFKARPELWGDRKRQSVHAACAPDLKRPIDEFRAPTNKAEAVWPRTAVLTPAVRRP